MNSCMVCQEEGTDVRKIGSKGVLSLIQISHKRADGLHEKMMSNCFMHESCRKKYLHIKREDQSTYNAPSSLCSRRSLTELFSYHSHCLICGQEIDPEIMKRHPDRASSVSKVELVHRGKSIFQETLMKVCNLRDDNLAMEVKCRITIAQDLPAVDAIYHRKCHKLFTNKLNIKHCGSSLNYRHLNLDNETAYQRLCSWLQKDSNMQKQHTFIELRKQLAAYLPEGIEPYTMHHLKCKLEESFGEQLICSELDGRKNVITFKEKATKLLHDSYTTTFDEENDENLRNITDIGSNIFKILQNGDFKDDFYPSCNENNIDTLESQIPTCLFSLIKEIVCGKKKDNIPSKRLVIIALCHAIMQASRPRAYISPLQLAIGLFVHQTTRSKVLIDVLSALGICCSYSHVLNFQKCATEKATSEGVPSGLTTVESGGGFCQWVADNFDWNEETISGHDTTHVMGIIACQVRTSSSDTPVSDDLLVKRKTTTASEILKSGSFCNIVLPFKQPLKEKMTDVIIQPIHPINISTLPFQLLDNLWLISSRLLNVKTPNWQGFMAQASNGSYLCSTVIFNPMIPLNPQTSESVYSTMTFVQKQANRLGQHCAVITFDQPLYLKAYTIKQEKSDQFQNMFIRLGGFHLLMSFLGSGCKIMEDSGLHDLWCEVYAKNSLHKIMEGKSYTKTLRACLLADAALHMLLLTNDKESNLSDLSGNKTDDMFGNDLNESVVTECNEEIFNLDPFPVYYEDQLPTTLTEEVVDFDFVEQSSDTQPFILDEEMPYMLTEETVTTSEFPMDTANDLYF